MSVGDKTTTTEDKPAIEYLKNGKIKIYDYDDDDVEIVYTLKLPRFGQFKEIKTALFEANDAIQDAAKEMDLTTPDMSDPKAVAAYASLSEKLIDRTYDELADVIAKVFDLLSDKKLPATDDLPSWLLADQAPITNMLQHWRTVPLGRG
jgi:uncharacterized protein with NRDE domain